MLECQTLLLSHIATSDCSASLLPTSSPVTSWDEDLIDSEILLSGNEHSLSFDGSLVPTISKVTADRPSSFVNLISATGWAYCSVSKLVELSVTGFSSVAFEGADGSEVEVSFLGRILALGLNLPPPLATARVKRNFLNHLYWKRISYTSSTTV